MPSQIVIALNNALRQNDLAQIANQIMLPSRWNKVWGEWASWPDRYDVSTPIKFAELANFPTLSGFHFYVQADFCNVTFTTGPDLSGAVFREAAYFRYAKFELEPNFRGVEFQNTADFHSASFTHGPVDFSESRFEGNFSLSVYLEEREQKYIPKISFNGCQFNGEANFSNRVFGGSADFRVKFFRKAPRFHNAQFRHGVEFGNIDEAFKDTRSDDAGQRYQTLKNAMDQQQALTEKNDFAALEYKARRHGFMRETKTGPFRKRFSFFGKWLVYLLWEKISRGGRSISRLILLYIASLIGSLVGFSTIYVLQCRNWFGDWWTCVRHGTCYAFSKQLHFVLKRSDFAEEFPSGTNRVVELETKLFGSNHTPDWVDALNFAQFIVISTLTLLMLAGIRYILRSR